MLMISIVLRVVIKEGEDSKNNFTSLSKQKKDFEAIKEKLPNSF